MPAYDTIQNGTREDDRYINEGKKECKEQAWNEGSGREEKRNGAKKREGEEGGGVLNRDGGEQI